MNPTWTLRLYMKDGCYICLCTKSSRANASVYLYSDQWKWIMINNTEYDGVNLVL